MPNMQQHFSNAAQALTTPIAETIGAGVAGGVAAGTYWRDMFHQGAGLAADAGYYLAAFWVLVQIVAKIYVTWWRRPPRCAPLE
ncbi:hypothetical protein [Methylocystis parvus]|uniref:hypothetical protein n=1 Tax=Methylocystis parvus TaxID=134 RepID=UPI003C748F4C